MNQYEYLTVNELYEPLSDKELNIYSTKGWDLVTVYEYTKTHYNAGEPHMGTRYIFKRPRKLTAMEKAAL